MGLTDTAKTVVEKVNSPWVNLAIIVTMTTTMVAGTKWGLAKIEDTTAKADTAVQAVKEMKGALDMFIKLQMESNALQRVEMGPKADAVPVTSMVDTLSKQIVIKYVDSTGAGIKRKGDTIWIPKADTSRGRVR